MVITDHELHLTCQVGLDIAFQFDDLDKIHGLFVILHIVTPGLRIF